MQEEKREAIRWINRKQEKNQINIPVHPIMLLLEGSACSGELRINRKFLAINW